MQNLSQPSWTVTKAEMPRARVAWARRPQAVELVLDRKLGVDHGDAATDPPQELRQVLIVLRADRQIDRGGAADDLGPFGLRYAAGDRDHDPPAALGGGLLQPVHAAELGIDLVGGLLADVAGVQDDEIGVIGGRGLGVAFACERVRHTMGIVDVHLAAERLDMDFTGSAHAGSAMLTLCRT